MTGRWAAARFVPGRHRSTGIDVGAGEVRIVVLSRRGRVADVRIEALEREPLALPEGADARWAAVARALSAAVARLTGAGVRCDTRGVMALRDDEMRTATLDLAGATTSPMRRGRLPSASRGLRRTASRSTGGTTTARARRRSRSRPHRWRCSNGGSTSPRKRGST